MRPLRDSPVAMDRRKAASSPARVRAANVKASSSARTRLMVVAAHAQDRPKVAVGTAATDRDLESDTAAMALDAGPAAHHVRQRRHRRNSRTRTYAMIDLIHETSFGCRP